MKISGFEFRPTARFQPGALTDANAVGHRLEALRKQFKGELTAADVVADATNKTSPLHSFFEWSDGKAAQAYRLQQARGLLRAVVAIYHEKGKKAVRTNAYVSIREAGAEHYRETSHALSVKKTRDMVLQQAWADLLAWRRRYAELREFAELIEVIDQLQEQMAKSA